MHALLSLLGVFFTTVLFYLAAGIAFVGLVFLIVYVGAVAILFLFVIMLLNVKSLTSKAVLIQHLTQSAAIISAVILFQQMYARVLTALVDALSDGYLRIVTVEPTTGEAVLFYVRYVSADINRLTALYTFHAPNFLVITGILLVALLGAIILATVTTERATTLADIRVYSAANPTAVFFLFLYFSTEIADLLSLLWATDPLAGAAVVFMSFYTPKDVYVATKNKSIMKSKYNEIDYCRSSRRRRRRERSDRKPRPCPRLVFYFASKTLFVGRSRHGRTFNKKQIRQLRVKRAFRFPGIHNQKELRKK